MLKNKYLYNDKELQNDVLSNTAFGQFDYGARFYDPVIGRWHTIDPLAEKSRRFNPYVYCYNNPMRFIDPDGMQTIGYIKRGPYGNNILVNGLTFLENISRAIVNTGIHAVNSVVSSYEIIRDDGLSGFLEAAGNDFSAMGSAIADGAKAIVTNPSVVVETLTNPEFLEQATANVAMMFAGNSSMNSTTSTASKGASSANNVSKSVSPNVQKALNSLKEIQSEGGIVKVNRLTTANQE